MTRLANGGWVVLAAVVFFVLAGIWQTKRAIDARQDPRPGDGKNVESYAFDLATCVAPAELLAPTPLPRDGLAILDHPPVMPVGEVAARFSGRRKYIVPSDRVVGLVIGAHARAYPIRVLTWHEVVNDTLGGVPIAVTYDPYGDAAVVFSRRLGDGVAAFGFSGLVYNGSPLVHDGESLYSPLAGRAICGPAAQRRIELDALPFAVLPFEVWLERRPGSTILDPDLELLARYKSDPYGSYTGSDDLTDYPIAPLPEGDRPRKTRVLAVVADGARIVFSVASVLERAGGDGQLPVRVGGARLMLGVRADPQVAWLEAGPEDAYAISAYWFAWHAMHPEDPLRE